MMNSANLPTQGDLESLYGAWNPMATYQGLQNQDLASQFRDQAYADNASTVRAGQMKNDQAALMNPLLLEKQQSDNTYQDLLNAGKTTSNTSEALDLGNKQSLNPDKLAAERAKLRTMFNDEQINQMSDDIWKAHVENIKSGDPVKIQETGSLLDLLGGASKAADRVQTRNLKEGDWINSQILANINADSRVNAAGMRGAGKTPASWQSQFNKLPTSSKKDTAAAAIATGRNPYTGDELTEDELAAFKASYDSAVATLDAGNAARGQAQGVTAGVDENKKIVIKNKGIPSSGNTASKLSDDDLINKYLNK